MYGRQQWVLILFPSTPPHSSNKCVTLSRVSSLVVVPMVSLGKVKLVIKLRAGLQHFPIVIILTWSSYSYHNCRLLNLSEKILILKITQTFLQSCRNTFFLTFMQKHGHQSTYWVSQNKIGSRIFDNFKFSCLSKEL